MNSELLYAQFERLSLPRLTIDVDRTVVRTGGTGAWAFRGLNPHHRKAPSYYPLLAQTGQILCLRSRSGNVHASMRAVPFLRGLIREFRGNVGRGLPLALRGYWEYLIDHAFIVAPTNPAFGAAP